MKDIRYFTDIDQVDRLDERARQQLHHVTDAYRFRANDYYLSLIDWNDPDDPIRRIIIPDPTELEVDGELDACNEHANYVAPGCQHKYPHTALLICAENCAGYCRYCFRKRLFMNAGEERITDFTESINYIREHKAITNVLLTGGDPLTLSTRRLETIIRELRTIDHVGVIRIGSKTPAFNPYRIIDDPDLPAVLARYSTRRKRIYVITHFDVVQELTDAACLGLEILHRAGVVMANQTPIIRGANDTPDALVKLMARLSFVGVPPYYFFQCRPTAGNRPYTVPIAEAYATIEAAKKRVSGLAKRARYVMSHALGKIEIVGLNHDYFFLKFHRARYQEDEGRFMMFYRNDCAFWLDDLIPADGQPHPVHERRGDTLTPRVYAVAQ
ncbi:MAG: KamA family radical SAM protein [candidate division Zixibacteria bacterium]|nr:KamA family radical SAM protein [candidate division Zixibacteria bacterium]